MDITGKVAVVDTIKAAGGRAFAEPVPAGSRVQVSATRADAEEVGGNGIRATIDAVMRVEGVDKPVCIAQMVHRYYKD